jgi:polyphosphate glucokinase
MKAFGIDIGGSGIKGATVDLTRGELATERHRIPTPKPSTPEAVAEVIRMLVSHFDWKGPIGCTFPGVVQHGVVGSAANVDRSWVDVNGAALFRRATGCPVTLLNDADAAGLAEMTFGAAKGEPGTVLVLTFGTGIGSALFFEGRLVPNTEFGHLELRGKDAEKRASEKAREDEDLSWDEWAGRVDEYLHHLEVLFSPDLFVIGGGASNKADRFLPRLTVKARVVPAALRNQAGIVGAALAAREGRRIGRRPTAPGRQR